MRHRILIIPLAVTCRKGYILIDTLVEELVIMEIILSTIFLNKGLQLLLGKHLAVLLCHNKSTFDVIKHIIRLKQLPCLAAKGGYKEDTHRTDQH